MAIERPSIQIEQTFATQSTTPASPDLNVTIVGPAYNLQDYTAANKANIAVSEYGSAVAACDVSGVPVGLPLVATTALSVAEPPNNTVGAILDSASVRVFLENTYVDIIHGVAGAVVDAVNTFTAAGATFVTAGVAAGDRIVYTSADGSPVTLARTVLSVTNETSLVMTANHLDVGSDINGAAYAAFTTPATFRVERKLADSQLGSSFVSVSGQNTDVLGAATALDNAVARTINSSDVFMEYRSLRQDLAVTTILESASQITSVIGPLDERNPLAVGAFCAFQNTGTSVQVFGITGDDLNSGTDRLLAYTSARDYLELRNDVYAIVPLASEASIVSLFKSHAEDLSTPAKSKFRVALGSAALPATTEVSPASTGATELDVADPIDVLYDIGAQYITNGVALGDLIIVTASTVAANIAVATYTVRRVISEDIIQIDSPFLLAGASDLTYTVTHGATTIVTQVASPSVSRQALNTLLDNGATFITSGAIAGDYVSVTSGTYVIASVLSENRVKIAGTEGELTSVAGAPTTNAAYSIGRTLDKAGQVAALSAIPAAYLSNRLFMVWPDKVKVSGVVNGLTGLQSYLPGYFAAACVGGMIAGNPAHQNFSGLPIAGLDSVGDSAGYFTNSQVEALSSAGWYLLLQDTPTAPPYALHSVTTDPTTLESSEVMIVKNFDYVAIFYRDILKPFLRGYNITDNVLSLIQDAFDAGTTELKSQTSPKIGSPLIEAHISLLEVLTTSADHVRIEAPILLPRMLNKLTLVFVA